LRWRELGRPSISCVVPPFARCPGSRLTHGRAPSGRAGFGVCLAEGLCLSRKRP